MRNMTCGLNVGWSKRIQNFWIRLAASITWLLPEEGEAQFRVIHNNWLRAWPEYMYHGQTQYFSLPRLRRLLFLPCKNRMCSTTVIRILVPTNKAPKCIVVILIRVSLMRCEKNFTCNTIVLWVDSNKVISVSRVTKRQQRPHLTFWHNCWWPLLVRQEKLCRVIGNLRLRGTRTQRTGGRYSITGWIFRRWIIFFGKLIFFSWPGVV